MIVNGVFGVLGLPALYHVDVGSEKKVGVNKIWPEMEVKIVLELVEILNHAAHQDNVQGGFHTMRILLMIFVIRAYQEHSQEQA